jgi:hypothetical protein
MNDLQTRINNITQLLSGESSKQNKVVMSLQSFSGLDITHFNNQQMKNIHKYMSAINEITSQYSSIRTYDDYSIISDPHINKILKNIQQLCLKLLID